MAFPDKISHNNLNSTNQLPFANSKDIIFDQKDTLLEIKYPNFTMTLHHVYCLSYFINELAFTLKLSINIKEHSKIPYHAR